MPLQPIPIWDLPTRLFHWLLALCVLGLGATGWAGRMDWHFRLGYAVLTLLLFRLLWGGLGGRWSRFGAFIYGPATLWRYLRGQGDASLEIGHSPSGALSVYALLLLLFMQVVSGLCSDDEISSAGPLAPHLSGRWVALATSYHRGIGPWILCALLALHVLTILYYLWVRGRNLIGPMISGRKLLDAATPATRDDTRTRLLAAGLFLLCAAAVAWLLKAAAS